MHRVKSASVAPVLSLESRATPVAEAASQSAIGAVTEPAPPAPAAITPLTVRAAYANNPYPAYPSSSRKMGEQGHPKPGSKLDENPGDAANFLD